MRRSDGDHPARWVSTPGASWVASLAGSVAAGGVMGRAYARAAAGSKSIAGRVFPGSGTTLHPIAAIMQAARALWPSKTALELAARTGASERAAKYWLARRCDLSAENLAELLRSDAGL